MGAYTAVKPEAQAKQDLSLLSKYVDLPFCKPDDFHITVMFCKDPDVNWRSYADQADPKQECQVTPLKTDRWMDAKGRWIIVLPVMSADLVKLHQKWNKQGLHHSFPSFRPHITLTEPLDPRTPLDRVVEAQHLIDKLVKDRIWYFNDEHIEDAKNYPPLLIEPQSKVPIRKLKLVEEAKSKAKGKSRKSKGARRGKGKGVSGIGEPPDHNPELDPQEEWSLRKHGFNAVGVHKRAAKTGLNQLENYVERKPLLDEHGKEVTPEQVRKRREKIAKDRAKAKQKKD